MASEQPLASLAGYEVLRDGGNAFDAAAATSFTLAVTLHQVGGLGGDFFGMFYEAKTGKVHCLNSSGWSPSGLTLDLVKSGGFAQVPEYGPLSCVVPGQVAGVWAMHRKFGGREFASLLRRASSYASKGFPASEGLCRSIAGTLEHLSPEAKQIFAPRGGPPSRGDWIRQERLGSLIELIAQGGADAFYRGEPADEIRKTLQSLGVPSKESDFRDFVPEWTDPLELEYGGVVVHETPPNSMGATSLLMLKLLADRGLSKFGPLSQERIDLTMEAAQVAYARKDRILGDPRFGKIDLAEFMKVPSGAERFSGEVREGDTTAFSVVDGEGNVVSCIQSLFRHFGSRVFVPAAGIMLSDRGSGFSITGPNKVEPRKRPLHTLSSLIIERGEDDRIALGTSGGDYRPILHTLFLTNLVDYGMTLEQTVEHPRFLWSGGRNLLVEAGYQDLGPGTYEITRLPMPGRTGVCQGIEARADLRLAVCDVRGDGLPAGF